MRIRQTQQCDAVCCGHSFLGTHFQGCICAVHCGGREYRMATYLGVRIEEYGDGKVTIRQGKMRLRVRRLEEASHDLKAPKCGVMSRTIREVLPAGSDTNSGWAAA